MRKIAFILVLFVLLASAQARFYIGFPGSLIVGSGFGGVGGVHIGTYKLYEDFGVRATAEFGAAFSSPVTLTYEGGLDGTYSFGEGVVFYTGGGLGYGGGALGDNSLYAGAFVGLDFDAGSVISIFVEINPRYYFANAGLVHVRSGVNFHIGDPSENPVYEAEDNQPWLEPYSADTTP